MNGSPLLAGRAAGSPLLTAGGAMSPKDDNGATPLSTGASAGSCELRRLTESLLSARPGDRLLVNLLRFRVYGLLKSVLTSIYQRWNSTYRHSTSDLVQLVQGLWIAKSHRTCKSSVHQHRLDQRGGQCGDKMGPLRCSFGDNIPFSCGR